MIKNTTCAKTCFNMSQAKIVYQTSAFVLIFLFLITPLAPVLAREAENIPVVSTESISTTEEIPVTESIPDVSAEPDETIVLQTEEVEPVPPLDSTLEENPIQQNIVHSPNKKLIPEIDESTGALVYRYNLDLPPGRNNLTPDLGLIYNSQNEDQQAMFGHGWSISIPYIQRVNKKGSDKLYTENYFVSSLDGELVPIGSSSYAAKNENGNFLKYELVNNVWTVTNKQGIVYKFGGNADSRQDDFANTTHVFKWMLSETRDLNNNYITYTYYKDAGQIYPSQITYTGNGATSGIFTVNFDRTAQNNTIPFTSTGFQVTMNYKISEIRTEINGVWSKKYSLAYTPSDNGQNILLNTITPSGKDISGTIIALPPIDFDYQTSVPNWTYASSWILPVAFTGNININGISIYYDTGARMADINGDGLTDIICNSQQTNSPCNDSNPKIWLNTGSGWELNTTWQFPFVGGSGPDQEAFIGANFQNLGLQLVDVNGDGLTDMMRGYSDGSNNYKYVYLNNGINGWTYTPSWVLPVSFIQFNNNAYNDTGARMADINGDGLVDILCNNNYSAGASDCYNNPKIWLNTGSGWELNTTWQFPFVGGTSPNQEIFSGGLYPNSNQIKDLGLQLVDINGDGLTDMVRGDNRIDYYDYSYKYVYLNNGINGWTYTPSWVLPVHLIVSNTNKYYDTGARMADINGDGLIDLLCNNQYSGDDNCYDGKKIFLNTGSGWQQSVTWQFPIFNYPNQSVYERFIDGSPQYTRDNGLRAVDVNGDGLTDMVRGYGDTKRVYLNNNSLKSNILKKIIYSQGGNTEIIYKPTAQFKDTSNNLLNPNVRINLNVVSKIKNNDTGGNTGINDYSYEGGLYYFNTYLDRKFAGFNKVIKTDGAGNITKTYYHQGNISDTTHGEYDDQFSKIGKIYRIEKYDSNNNLYSKTINKWDKYNIGTGHDFVKLAVSLNETFDGNSTHKDTAEEYTYNNTYGNLTQKRSYGQVMGTDDGLFIDTGTDEFTENISYATNMGNYVVGLPSVDTVLDQNSSKVRESKMYYDNLPLNSVGVGNQTKIENRKAGTTYVNTQKTYNSYGNVLSSIDENGKTTTYFYDSYNLYPTTITDPLNQTTQYLYDYAIGKPKQTTDKNGFNYQTNYDGLGRILQEKVPDSVAPYAPVLKKEYVYTDTPLSVSVKKTDYLDNLNSVDTYQYFDGLGRLIQERKEAEIAGNFNVKDLVYNNLGLLQKESLKYTSTGNIKTSPTTITFLYTNYTYDPLERPLTVVNNLGTTSTTYDDWKTTITDANGKVKNYYKDAYDNLVKVIELNDGDAYVTNYEWNGNQNLTKITDALNNVRNFTYDSLGRRLTAEDLHAPLDTTYGTWTYVYDNVGNLTQSVSPESKTINYTYNSINQPLTEDYTGATGTEISYTYSGCTNGIGKLCSIQMTSGANTTYTYNSNGNIVNESKVIDAITYATSNTYDREGNILNIIYPDNAEVKYTYNTAGLLEKIERKESGGAFTDVVSNFDYSPMEQITSTNFSNNVLTTNTYDPTKLYRLTRKLTENALPSKLQDLNYLYDPLGNILSITDASNTSTAKTMSYTYDDLSRLISATATNTQNQENYVETFLYDALGNVVDKSEGDLYTYAGNQGTNYGNPHAVTNISSPNYTFDFTYDKNGNLTKKLTTTSAVLSGSVNPNGALTTVWYESSVTGNQQLGLQNIGNGASPVTLAPYTLAGLSPNSTYTFRIVAEGETAIYGDWITFTTKGDLKPVVISATANPGNTSAVLNGLVNGSGLSTDAWYEFKINQPLQLTHFENCNITTALPPYTLSGLKSGKTYIFRVVANNEKGTTYGDWITFKTTKGLIVTADNMPPTILSATATPNTPFSLYNNSDYVWNYRNELTGVSSVVNTDSYQYDNVGSRVKASVGGVNTYYPNKYYDTSLIKKTKYIYAGDVLVAMIDTVGTSVTPTYIHTDHLSGTNVVSDSTGAISQTLDYYSYGQERICSGICDAKKKYIGQYYDTDTALDYLNARYYDSKRGQFISEDSVFLNPESAGKDIFKTFLSDPQSQNSYSYAKNNPIILKDPDGKFIPLLIGAVFMYGPSIISAVEIGMTAYFAYQVAQRTGEVIGTATSNAPSEYKNAIYQLAIEDAGALYSASSILTSGVSVSSESTTVGRWMSKVEYSKMLKTGNVQEGSGGMTYVSTSGPESFAKQATVGQNYVEFKVPKSSLTPASKSDWKMIVGSNATNYAKQKAINAGSTIGFPKASNIINKITKTKK